MAPPKVPPKSSINSFALKPASKRFKSTICSKNERRNMLEGLQGITKKPYELSVLCGGESCHFYLPAHNGELEAKYQQRAQFLTWPKDGEPLVPIVDSHTNDFRDQDAEEKQGRKRDTISRNKDLFPRLPCGKISWVLKEIEESMKQLFSDAHASASSSNLNSHDVGSQSMLWRPRHEVHAHVNVKYEVVETSTEFLKMNERMLESECQNPSPGTPSSDDEEYEKMMVAVYEELPCLDDSRASTYNSYSSYCGLHVDDLLSVYEFDAERCLVDFA